jgi:GTP cyclohydrolase I
LAVKHSPRPKKAVDKVRIERAVREILYAIGEDPDREGLRDTPRRVAESYGTLFSGVGEDPARHLEAKFGEGCSDPVVLRDVAFSSVCDHHLSAMVGKVHVGYLPRGRVAGFSDLVRVVELLSRRPQLQERLTAEIADALQEGLGTRGAMVVVEAEQLCVTMRGVQKPGTVAVTSAARALRRRRGPPTRDIEPDTGHIGALRAAGAGPYGYPCRTRTLRRSASWPIIGRPNGR